MAYEMGASLHIHNVQGLTPLTLSAKLARRDMFMYILKIEREIYWQMGSMACAAYPLEYLDTINTNTGHLNNDSAVNLIIYGVSENLHLFSSFSPAVKMHGLNF